MRFRHLNKINHLIDYEVPSNKDYIILESLDQVKEGINYKGVHIITLIENETILIGRTNDVDVSIYDISVSRSHGSIYFDCEKNIILRDLKSKFGTLALIQNEYSCDASEVILQIGRTLLEYKCLPIYQYISTFQEKILKLNDNKK